MCETLDEFGEVEFAVKRKGQNKKKKGKRGGQLSEADKKALLAYGPELPTTKNRATQMIGDILYEQMEVFKVRASGSLGRRAHRACRRTWPCFAKSLSHPLSEPHIFPRPLLAPQMSLPRPMFR